MEHRKVVIFAALISIGFIGVVWARNDLILGTYRPDAVLLYQNIFNVTGIPGQIISNNYAFSNQFRNITLFRALDLNTNNTGGYAYIVNGGIGHRNVTFNLRSSAVGRGYTFNVDIYGV
ncbi:probable salivary secreted peptide [Chironomus tepperi]|uniref:probable salivary secreted peptide n=1 Tax=Chironomus tepperi TaxID=113505 RepID=UPI00391F0DA8